jgi:hypothetical protein
MVNIVHRSAIRKLAGQLFNWFVDIAGRFLRGPEVKLKAIYLFALQNADWHIEEIKLKLFVKYAGKCFSGELRV